MANFNLNTTAKDIDILLGANDEAKITLLENLIGNEQEQKSVAQALKEIFKEEFIQDGGGGMIDIQDLKVKSVNLKTAEKGKVELNYKVNRFFACAGEELEKQKKETLDLFIDAADKRLTLSLFELPKY